MANTNNSNRVVPNEIFQKVSACFMIDYAQILRNAIYYALKKTNLQKQFFAEAVNPTNNGNIQPLIKIQDSDESDFRNADEAKKLEYFDIQALLKSIKFLRLKQGNHTDYFSTIFLSAIMNVKQADKNTVNKFVGLVIENISHRNKYFGHTNKHTENMITVKHVEEIISGMLAVIKYFRYNAKIIEKTELFKTKANKIITELKNPMSVKKICDSYRDKYNDEISEEFVGNSLKYFKCVINNNLIYVEDTDILLENLKEREDNRKALIKQLEIKLTKKKIYQKTAYKGGMMTEEQFGAFLDGYITVLSRDFVFSDQFYKLMTDHIIPLYKKYNKKIIIPYSIACELEDMRNRRKNFVFLDDSAVEKARELFSLLKSVKQSDMLLTLKISADDEYSNQLLCDSLSLYPDLNFCILTLNSNFLNELDYKNTENILLGKFMISGKFRLYSDSLRNFIDDSDIEPALFSGKNVDDKYYYEDGTVIEIIRELTSGGEGKICLTPEKGLIAKIFKDSKTAESKYEKLKYMIDNNPCVAELCWPEKLLYNSEKRFSGYTMKRFSGKELGLTVLKISSNGVSNKYLRAWKRKDLVAACCRIAKIEESLQRSGKNILMGDVNPRNILIDIENGGKISFVDCDSYQTGDFNCNVGMAEYISPYMIKKYGRNIDFKKAPRTKDDENYAFAVLFFQILMLGIHPMAVSQYNNDVIKATEDASFIFPFEDISQPEKTVYGTHSILWNNMPYKLKRAFAETFTANELYSMSEWVDLFEKYMAAIDSGKEDNQLMPNKIKSEFDDNNNDLFVNIKCEICGKEITMDKRTYNKRVAKDQLLYCSYCAPAVEDWKQKDNYSYCLCDKCGKKFKMPTIDAMTLVHKHKKTLCSDCLNLK